MAIVTSNEKPPTIYTPSRHDNPFATCWTRPGAIPFFFSDGNSADRLVEKLRAQNWRGEIVGPHGSGKSTLVETLKPKLMAAGINVHQIALRADQRRLPHWETRLPWSNRSANAAETLNSESAAPTPELLIVDGYEQLGRLARWQLKRRCRHAGIGLLVTSHRPTGLPTLIQLAPERRLVEQLAVHLCTAVPSQISAADIAASHDCYGSDVREIFFDLYDRHEQLRRASRTAGKPSS